MLGALEVAVCLGWLASVHGGQAAVLPAEPPARFTNAAQLLRLPAHEAARHHPVTLTGTVTFHEPRSDLFFVQDQTAGAYVYATNWTQPLKPGQQVVITGVTGRGLASPIVMGGQIKVLGEGPLPPAHRTALEEILAGRLDSQWVEIEGVIRCHRQGWLNQILEIASGNNRLEARVTSTNDLAGLIGARVRIQGVAANQYDSLKKNDGFCLYTSGRDRITVLRPPLTDPYSGSLVLSANLLAATSADGPDGLVFVRGVLTMQLPGKWLTLRDPTGAVRVLTTQSNLLAVGSMIEAAGYPARRGGNAVLEDAQFREVGMGPAPVPVKIRLSDSGTAGMDGELVQLDAEYIQTLGSPPRRTFLAKSGNQILNLQIPANYAAAMPSLDPGSQLRLTGILQFIDDGGNSSPTTFLWLRSPADLLFVHTMSPTEASHMVRNWFLLGLLLIAASVAIILRASPTKPTIPADQYYQRESRRRNWRDALLLVLAAGGLFGVASAVDFFELVVAWARRHEDWQVDELLTLFMILTWLIGLYSWRRWRDIEREVSIRKHAEAELREGEKQLRELLEDRQRLGRDLHDGIIQSIYAIGLAIEDCRRLVEEDPQLARQRLGKSLADLNTVIRDVRNFISGLEPEALKGAEFRTALKSLVLTMNESGMAKFVLQVDPLAADTLNTQQTVHLLHIAQEAMSNSLRHGGAKTTVVSLQRQSQGVRFEVHDDGIGFEIKSARPEGRGLRNIAARAQQIGAHFDLQSSPSGGTRLILDLPANRPTING